MPGITVWMVSGEAAPDSRARFDQAQRTMLHAPDYAASVDVDRPGFLIGHVCYPEYPVKLFAAGPHRVYLEGRVYNKSAATVERELAAIAERVLSGAADAESLLKPWILESDGEYLVVMVAGDGREMLACTGPLGRLPLYYYFDDACLLLAREAKFIKRLKPELGFDRMGWAQVLWTGHPLGGRTLFEGICRAPAAMLLRAQATDGRVRVRLSRLFTMNFDDKDTSGKSVGEYGAALADRLVEVCRDVGSHPDVSQSVLSLSGGQDSKAVAAAMVKAGVPLVAATFQDEEGTATEDVRIAEQVARILSIPWHRIDVRRASPADVERLVWMKGGLNYARMAFILAFLDKIVQTWGRRAQYITGEGGNKVFPDLRSRLPIGSTDGLVRRIFRRLSSILPERAEAIMRLPRGTLYEAVRQAVSDYPEETFEQRLVHYIVYERGRMWTYEAEDRNRFFLWDTGPLTSFRFFQEAMRVPDKLKRGYRLCAEIQRRLSPECAAMTDAFMGAPVGSLWFRVKLESAAWVRLAPRPLKRLIRRMAGMHEGHVEVPPEILADVRAGLAPSHGLDELMDPVEVDALLQHCTEFQVNYLWTLVKLASLWRERG